MPPAVLISAIAGITTLEALALWKGIDGQLLTLALVLIAGIAGFVFSRFVK